MKIINIIFTGLLIMSLSSCKDFLDVEPSNLGDSKTSIQTPSDAKIMMNGLMRNMISSSYYGRNMFMYGDAKGGDMTIFMQGRGLDGLYTFNHSKTTGSNSTFWTQIYNGILQANNLLESIQRIDPSSTNAEFNVVKGQALTARAVMYFDLVRLYGKAYSENKTSFGVPNIITTLPATAQPLRATVEENYNQIMGDLKASAPLLPKIKTSGYLNYYANLAMQARVYLYMDDHTNALKAAQEIIAVPASLYRLYTNAEWVPSWKAQFGLESIFELVISPNEGDLLTASLGFYLRRAQHGGSAALGFFMASTPFLNRLGQDPADVRWGVMSNDESSGTRLGSLYKYSGGVALEGDGKTTATAVNIKVIRLSEIYLIAAEAALTIDKTLAAGYLNAIRKRSPNLPAVTAGNITIDMILDERSKELFGEGQRYFDLIRLNKSITFDDAFGGLTITNRPLTITRAFNKTILPISQDEINANPGLAAQQNPGYN
ncbi:RagB/SusD family nutrient uptake outer membrane protein [Pedobacter ginsengisoli]|uniref:RagB/SusD family nutrient uptake outer membrane protein n=1 Tax=Pedobacter ginsengisoli TaxID=363852 RepID=UPI00254CB1D4|nr:RagB/SusD family nutrient uptake outer membrane protein [Pedobacter ginsengisoli]